jgi:SAM-dependent methyltransferase
VSVDGGEVGQVVGGGALVDRSSVERVLAGRRPQRAVSKIDFLAEHVGGRDVLDVGCIQHSWRQCLDNPNWLHWRLAEASSTCMGVDYLADDAARLAEEGFDIVAGDVLVDDPPGKFDVVVFGDLIEHLENPAKALEYAAAALRPGGVALMTTPNATYIGQFLTVLSQRRPAINPEHVTIYDPFTFCNLIERSPLEVAELRWLSPSWPALWDSKSRLVRKVVSPLLARAASGLASWRPYFSCDFAAVLEMRTTESMTPTERAAHVVDSRSG